MNDIWIMMVVQSASIQNAFMHSHEHVYAKMSNAYKHNIQTCDA